MKEPFFNLIDEPWIKVMMCDGREDKVSLRDAFEKGSEIKTLAGETSLQDNAILRLLVAVSVTCFYRYEIDGNEVPLKDGDESIALERFRDIWKAKCFPHEFVDAYFDKWHDRFFLFGGDYPFYQVSPKYVRIQKTDVIESKKATISKVNRPADILYEIAPFRKKDKLNWVNAMSFNGEVLQSNNSASPFASKDGEDKNKMTFDEAARWLIYYMNYADLTIRNPSVKHFSRSTFTSSGANVHPAGENFFETIMLCSVLFDNNEHLYQSIVPSWELDSCAGVDCKPYGEAMPDNLPELYTQLSRKIILHSTEDYVDGMYAGSGDSYGSINAFIEPMFAFVTNEDGKGEKRPYHMKADCTGWKEYEAIFAKDTPSDSKSSKWTNPSRWVNTLFDEDILPYEANIPFVMSDIAYNKKKYNCGVVYTVNTHLVLNHKFFEDSNEIRNAREVFDCADKISGHLRQFGQQIALAYGAKKNDKGKFEPKDLKISNKLVEEYELSIRKLMEGYLAGNVSNLKKVEETLVDRAVDTIKKALDNLNILDFVGHGDQYIGDADIEFGRKIRKIRKELGLLDSQQGGEKNERKPKG